MADRRDFFRQIAVNYRQLAELAANPEIKQRMLDMAAHYQAKAEEAMSGRGLSFPPPTLSERRRRDLARPGLADRWHSPIPGIV
jgi:hypothetical protein